MLYEPSLLDDEAKALLREQTKQAGPEIPIPTDVVVATTFSERCAGFDQRCG
jgi:3-phosphoglycerate kinase